MPLGITETAPEAARRVTANPQHLVQGRFIGPALHTRSSAGGSADFTIRDVQMPFVKIIAAALVLAGTASSAFAGAALTTQSVTLYDGPVAGAAVVATVAPNARVGVLWCGMHGQWCLVTYHARQGFASPAALKQIGGQLAVGTATNSGSSGGNAPGVAGPGGNGPDGSGTGLHLVAGAGTLSLGSGGTHPTLSLGSGSSQPTKSMNLSGVQRH